MPLAYVPQSAGKGATSGNIRNFNPRLAGSYSRTGAIIQGVYAGYRFVKANYKLFTGIGAVSTGAAVTYDGGIRVDAPQSQRQQAYQSSGNRFRNGRNYPKQNNMQCCCHPKRKFSRRTTRRSYNSRIH